MLPIHLVVARILLVLQTSMALAEEYDFSLQPCSSSSSSSCPTDTFCSYNLTTPTTLATSDDPSGFCQPCLDHPGACTFSEFTTPLGQQECLERCTKPKKCSASNPCLSGGEFFCNYYNIKGNATTNDEEESNGTCEMCNMMQMENTTDECLPEWKGLTTLGAQDCFSNCKVIDRRCNADARCPQGTFCAYDLLEGEEDETDTISGAEGSCQYCNWHTEFCFEMGLSPDGLADCLSRCADYSCAAEGASTLTVDGHSYDSNHMKNAPYAREPVTGVLVDFGLGLGADSSAVDLSNVDGPFICLISRGATFFYRKVVACETRGGVAAIIYNSLENEELFAQFASDQRTMVSIPTITLRKEDGEELLTNYLGYPAELTSEPAGRGCIQDCSDRLPCGEGYYCDYDNDEGWGSRFGLCQSCPGEGEADCYFSDWELEGAQHCAERCGSKLQFPECKLCGSDVDSATLTKGEEGEDVAVCDFCPSASGTMDREFQNLNFPLFGAETRCIDVKRYFDEYNIPATDRNCELAVMFNFVCGCEGPGYMQANTEPKRSALVWLPRATAILSMMGSLWIIYGIAKNKKRRAQLKNQLMLVLSIFDFIGSLAYSMTSLPIPEEEYVQGAKGNDATCVAQGFFIQIGTIAGYVNVSLAMYYLMIIKFGWSENRIKKYSRWFFAIPIVFGLAFAFAGIPFYTNMILWCNNGSKWWPEIPVILAIASATAIMCTLCVHVHKEEQASKKWRQAGNPPRAESFSKAVFWQSIWYLIPFYFTWPPYLALQYVWSAGQYSVYGFVLFAGAVVPMQGFWNCIAYKKGDIKETIRKISSRAFSSSTANLSTRFTGSRSRRTSADTYESDKRCSDVLSGPDDDEKSPTSTTAGIGETAKTSVSQDVSTAVQVESGGSENEN